MKPALLWIGSSLALVAITFGLWSLRALLPDKSLSPLAIPFAEAEQTFAFEDGTQLELLQIGVGKIEDGDPHAVSSGGIFSGGSSSSGSRGNLRFTQEYKTTDHLLSSLSFSSGEGTLLLELRALAVGGFAKAPERIHVGGKVYQVDANSSEEMLGPVPTAEEIIKGTGNKDLYPDLLFQIKDSAGNWLNGDQCSTIEEDPEHRFAVGFPAWPRNQPSLEIRVISPREEPQEFSLLNPGYTPTPEPWKAQERPATHDDKEFSITLRSLRKTTKPAEGERIFPVFDLKSKVKRDGVEYPDAFSASTHQALGHYGSIAFDNLLDPSERVLRFDVTISPSDSYPLPISDAVIFAETKVDADGKIDSPNVVSNSLGITKTSIEPDYRDGALRIGFEGEWFSPSEESAADIASGGWSSAILRIYIGDDPYSSGDVSSNDSSSGSSGGHTNFSRGYIWEPARELKAGQRIRIALQQPAESKTVQFFVDRDQAASVKK